jgi:hypothetical protein
MIIPPPIPQERDDLTGWERPDLADMHATGLMIGHSRQPNRFGNCTPQFATVAVTPHRLGWRLFVPVPGSQ